MKIVDVNEYLHRIKYNGSKEPNLENLMKLCEHQVMNIPTDTLDLFGGPGKSFDLHYIYRVMVKENRGGFCYELNVIFGEFLKEFGYDVAFLEGNYYLDNDNFAFPFNHMLLKVKLNDEVWIVDVGYGAQSYYLPKKFECSTEQSDITGTYRFRLLPGSKVIYLQEKHVKTMYNMDSGKKLDVKRQNLSKFLNQSEEWIIIQKFSTKEHTWEDFKEGWDGHLDDPDSYIMGNSFLSVFHQNGGNVLWGYNFLEIEFVDSTTEKRRITEIPHSTLDDEKALLDLIRSKFGITLKFKLNNLRSIHLRK